MIESTTKKHILILSRGPFYGHEGNVNVEKARILSSKYTGDIVHTVLDKAYITHPAYGFTITGCYTPLFIKRTKPLFTVWFYALVTARVIYRHFRVKRYDVIISREAIVCGLLSGVLASLLRIKSVVEVNGNYANPVLWHEGNPGKLASWKHRAAMRIVPWAVNRANAVRLLYPWQLDAYGSRVTGRAKIYVFHEFSRLRELKPSDNDENYVLFLGNPWYIKGVDILIKAFNRLPAHCYRGVRLEIVGWIPEPRLSWLKKMVEGEAKVGFSPSVDHEKALELIANSSFLVLPSRSEAMGRVVLEAMAQAKAVVAANVDGIPHYVEHGKNGYLFNYEDVEGLARAMEELIENKDVSKRMGEQGRMRAMTHYTEDKYLELYTNIIETL